jgi:hypothetical protein
MSQWGEAGHRVRHILILPATAQAATGAPGGELAIEPGLHVAATYQVVLPGGRVVHEGALTLHGPATPDRALPSALAEALETLCRHAEKAVTEHEGIPPA